MRANKQFWQELENEIEKKFGNGNPATWSGRRNEEFIDHLEKDVIPKLIEDEKKAHACRVKNRPESWESPRASSLKRIFRDKRASESNLSALSVYMGYRSIDNFFITKEKEKSSSEEHQGRLENSQPKTRQSYRNKKNLAISKEDKPSNIDTSQDNTYDGSHKESNIYSEEKLKENKVFKKGIWFLYYYYLDSLRRMDEVEPKIAQFILEILDGKNFTLDRVGVEKTCKGTFTLIEHTKVGKFDITSDDNSYDAHFKIDYPASDNDILLGFYNSYSSYDLEAGTILLEKFDPVKHQNRKLKPKLLWRNMEGDEFDNINESIFAFLAIKKYNHLHLPGDASSLDKMKTFLDRKALFDKTNLRFVDFKKPKLFIATPQTSRPQDASLGKAEEGALKDISDTLKAKYPEIEVCERDYQMRAKADPKTKDICKELYRTKYFIVILGDMKEVKVSLSTTLLGVALGYCKHACIIYKEGDISERFKAENGFAVESYPYLKSLSKDKKQILEDIAEFIEEHP